MSEPHPCTKRLYFKSKWPTLAVDFRFISVIIFYMSMEKNVLSFAAQKQIAIICQLANRVFFSRSRIGMGFFSGLLPVCVRVIVIKINKWLSVLFKLKHSAMNYKINEKQAISMAAISIFRSWNISPSYFGSITKWQSLVREA